MANLEAKLRIPRLDAKEVTLTLHLDIRQLRVRMAIGVWLIKLGCRVIGLGVKVEPIEFENPLDQAIRALPDPADAPPKPPPPTQPPGEPFRKGG